MIIKLTEKIKETKIDNDKAMAEILTKILNTEQKADKMKEHFWGIYLNARLSIIKIELITLGILNANLVHPREVYAPALESRACSLIIAHNHPSGDIEPSEDDLEITKRLIEAGKILGIELIEHLIITEKGFYFSFKRRGLIK